MPDFFRGMLERSGKSQNAVCKAIGLAQSALSHVIRGRSEPTLKTFITLGDQLGYQVLLATKESVHGIVVKDGAVEVNDRPVRGQASRIERLASYLAPRLSPKEMDEVCRMIDVHVEMLRKNDEKKRAKAV